ncbi:helix-turn-helix domain-containing protein [Chryseobacterium sp. JV274]|uniref:helix-turn-helix domain-containing protein n=1 Tax=Chryseobacterium sp. JV274 TaxID=1932669 RepID=UPI000987D011|nr:helix-turn-helix transcriptional regulator [Chryseobacterium sp. JV274]
MNEKKLKDLRKNAKLSQQQLADLVGVDRRSIINYEKGENIPVPVAKLLHILLETDYLLKLNSNDIKVIELKEENSMESLIEDMRIEFTEKIDDLSNQLRASKLIEQMYLKSIVNHFDIKPREITEDISNEKLERKKQ